jgi:GAF domain-containing protein
MTKIQSTDRASLDEALRTGGLQRALNFLNRRVEHRYTAIYRLRSGVLHNACLEDKRDEMRPEYLAAVPLDVSFCQFVLRDGLFETSNSASDRRLDGHPYQGAMIAYTGVPLVDVSGELVGTICHFDVTERTLADTEFQLLQLAARILPEHVLRAPL